MSMNKLLIEKLNKEWRRAASDGAREERQKLWEICRGDRGAKSCGAPLKRVKEV